MITEGAPWFAEGREEERWTTRPGSAWSSISSLLDRLEFHCWQTEKQAHQETEPKIIRSRLPVSLSLPNGDALRQTGWGTDEPMYIFRQQSYYQALLWSLDQFKVFRVKSNHLNTFFHGKNSLTNTVCEDYVLFIHLNIIVCTLYSLLIMLSVRKLITKVVSTVTTSSHQ